MIIILSRRIPFLSASPHQDLPLNKAPLAGSGRCRVLLLFEEFLADAAAGARPAVGKLFEGRLAVVDVAADRAYPPGFGGGGGRGLFRLIGGRVLRRLAL